MSELAEFLHGDQLRSQNSDGGGPNSDFDKNDLVAAWNILSGIPERPEKMPSIVLDPSDVEDATSWLGGLPVASKQFIWPCGKNGKRLHFMGQIDLKSLHACYEGITPLKSPASGAIAFFFDRDSWVIVFIDDQAIVMGNPIQPPEDLVSLRELGFFCDTKVFSKRPVRLRAEADSRSGEETTLTGHRLFGHGWVRSDLAYDLRGRDPVLTIEADKSLGTESEHEAGLSFWQGRRSFQENSFKGGFVCQHNIC